MASVDSIVQPLLATPEPFPQESLFGYVLRLAEANGYDSVGTIFSYINITADDLAASPAVLQKLAEITARETFSQPTLVYRDHSLSEGNRHVILGHPATYSHRVSPFDHERPKVCPECVRDKGFIEAFWDLRFAVACPVHQRLPVDTCLCNKRLTWRRPELNTCKCGQSFLSVARCSANPRLVALMSWLYAKVTGSAPIDAAQTCGFPEASLRQMTLQSLLRLIHVMGEFAASENGAAKQTDRLATVSAAAELLSDWPVNFHRSLRTEYHQNESGTRKNTTGFRLRHLRAGSLRNRVNDCPDLRFVVDAYYQYGRDNDTAGIVDERTDGIPASSKRFVSLQGAAVGLGISTTTLSKWRKAGLVEAKAVQTGKAVRYVIDQAALRVLKKPLIRPMHAKGAAAHLGLPVSTIYQLREVGVLSSTQPETRARSFYLPDLDSFLMQICERADQLRPSQVPADAVSFAYVVKKMKLFAKTGKADFVVAYLEGLVLPLGRTGDTLADIFFKADTVKRFVDQKRNEGLAGTISQTTTADELDCAWRTIPVLIQFGLLSGVDTNKGQRVRHESLVAFKAAYASLQEVAKRFDMTPGKVPAVIEANGLQLLKIPGKPPSDRLGFIRRANLAVIKGMK